MIIVDVKGPQSHEMSTPYTPIIGGASLGMILEGVAFQTAAGLRAEVNQLPRRYHEQPLVLQLALGSQDRDRVEILRALEKQRGIEHRPYGVSLQVYDGFEITMEVRHVEAGAAKRLAHRTQLPGYVVRPLEDYCRAVNAETAAEHVARVAFTLLERAVLMRGRAGGELDDPGWQRTRAIYKAMAQTAEHQVPVLAKDLLYMCEELEELDRLRAHLFFRSNLPEPSPER